MKKVLYAFLSLTLLLTACQRRSPLAHTGGSDADTFAYWKEKVLMDTLWATYPEWASEQGYHKYDYKLVIPDASSRAASLAFADYINGKLKQYPFDGLSDLDKTDYKLLETFASSIRFNINELKEWEWNPASYSIGGALDYVINNSPQDLHLKMVHVAARCERVPAYYSVAKKNINRPTREHTALAIKQSEGVLYFFDQLLPDSLKVAPLSAEERDYFLKNTTVAKEAVLDYIHWLKELEKGFTAENTRPFAIGKDLYEKKFALDIESGSIAAHMYQKAENRKAELHAQMYEIAKGLWPKYLSDKTMPKDTLEVIQMVINKASEKHCKRDSFIATIEQTLPELIHYINDNKLITLDPTKPLKVRKTPEYMAGVAGASINNPGPYDANGNTYYNVTPLTAYSDEKAESYLREYNEYVLQILNIHEAIPGHYVQLIYANRSPSIIKAVFGNGAMIEGWACYTERMMIESGYHQSPEMQLFYDKWNLRACCNFILDYNLQTNGWTMAQAKDLLVKQGFQQAAEAEEKYKRATLSQVQLASYFNGQTEILDLREEMKKKLGDKFNLKAFHEQFLSYGSAPVKEIRTLMMK